MEISVIVCTYNRAPSLVRTLESLKKLNGTASLAWEIIVVDNNSTDNTRSVTESFVSRANLNVRYIFEARQGLSYARNRGISEAAGDIIIFIDDDVILPPQWLLEMKKAFDDYQAAAVGGKVLLDKSIELPPWWHEQLRAPLSLHDLGDEVIISDRDHPTTGELLGGGNAGFRRSALERNGAFRTDLGRVGNRPGGGEDSEIVRRFQHKGETVVYYPRAFLYHSPNMARFTRDALPRYFYYFGMTQCQVELVSREATRHIGGVAVWRYRWLLENFLRAFLHMLTLDQKEIFFQRMQIYKICGYVVGIMTIKRSALCSVKPEPVAPRSAVR